MNTTSLGTNHMDAQYDKQIEAFVVDGLGRTPDTEPIQPMPLQEYRNLCRAYLGNKAILTSDLLAMRLNYIRQDSKLKEHFSAGNTYCPAIIPFSNFGNPLLEDEIAKGHALRTLVIDPQGKTINGFSQNPSRVFNRLPLEVQQLAFGIDSYESNDLYQVSPQEREKVAAKYEAAYRKLVELVE
ncbi:MAG: hypothetical protein NTX63_05220 [Candidatus Peregrinibacteria bacterium]|nr:hypothetical protein [Candidatus Peregrinibacteria bacterium]